MFDAETQEYFTLQLNPMDTQKARNEIVIVSDTCASPDKDIFKIIPDDIVPDDTVPDDTVPDDTVPDDTISDDRVPDDVFQDDSISVSNEEVSENFRWWT